MVLDNRLQVRVLWPSGYSARFEPFVVFDDAGKEVARSGDLLHAGGEGPFVGEADSCGRGLWVMLLDTGRS